MEYDNKERIAIFKNTQKREGKQDADYNGTYTDADGNDYWVNLWKPKEGANATAPVLSGSIRKKEQRQNQPSRQSSDPFSDEPHSGLDF